MKTLNYRKYGPIPTLKRGLDARRFLFFDTETATTFLSGKMKHLEFRLGYAIYVEFYDNWQAVKRVDYPLSSRQDFLDCLFIHADGPTTLYVVAHNMQFDLQILDLPFLFKQEGIDQDLPILSWHATLWTVHIDKKPVKFMDSMNLFPGKLEQLGHDLHFPKLKGDPTQKTRNQTLVHCKRDTEILFAAFAKYLRWLNDNKLGYFCETLSWQAMTAYRTRFMDKEIIVHDDPIVLSYERLAYHGARTECFYIGERSGETFTLLDVNSMYGFVMANNVFPVEYVGIELNVKPDKLVEKLQEFYCIALVELETDENAYPVRTRSKLTFPEGRYKTWLHHSELSFATGRGHTLRANILITYRHEPIFGPYVEFFSDRRRLASDCGDKFTERLCKLFVNTLSGKFGQRNSHTALLGTTSEPGIRHYTCKIQGTDYVFDQYDWLGKVFSSIRSGEKANTSPAIAGAITAYGRMHLWELMNHAGKANVYYIDTDSMLVNSSGLDRLAAYLDPDELGRLKSVNSSDHVQLFGPKDYTVGSLSRHKGFSASTGSGIGSGETMEQFSSFRTALTKGERGFVTVRDVTKQRRAAYDKGRVLPSGFVQAWRLPDDLDQPVFDGL